VHTQAGQRAGFFISPPSLETAVETYYEYLRSYSQELGARIVEMYPPVYATFTGEFDVAARLESMLRSTDTVSPRLPVAAGFVIF
jgi:hypothetical protein